MKKLLGIMLLTMTSIASANTIKIYSTWDYTARITPRFEINADLERAWLEIEVDSCGSDSDCESDEVRVKLDGLTYDAVSKQIIYNSENVSIVCAEERTRGRGIFRNTRMIETGNCTFENKFEIKMVDDGFFIKKKKYQTLYFKTK